MLFVSSLEWEGFSTHVEKHVESSLAFKDFGQHMFRYTLCSRRYRRGLVITSGDALCFLAGMVGVWSSYVVIHFCSLWHLRGFFNTCCINFVSSLAWEGFGQHMLRRISCPLWHGRALVNTS
jgi:hypothetical protein